MKTNSYSFQFVSNCIPYEITLSPGKYIFEAWGASGGNGGINTRGKGGYTRGVLSLHIPTAFFIVVGGKGSDSKRINSFMPGGCNGGGKGGKGTPNYGSGGGGGGATDIRLNESISSRILVAGGGGGSSGLTLAGGSHHGGFGGGLIAGDGEGYAKYIDQRRGGTQDSGYLKGIGQDGRDSPAYADRGAEGAGGGGGGFYGGKAIQATGIDSTGGGGGGSSYISSTLPYRFTNIEFKNGDQMYKSPEGIDTSNHFRNGFFHITQLTICTSHPKLSLIIFAKLLFISFITFSY